MRRNSEPDGEYGPRPLRQEILLMVIPILLTEGVILLRDYLRRRSKRLKKLERKRDRAREDAEDGEDPPTD